MLELVLNRLAKEKTNKDKAKANEGLERNEKQNKQERGWAGEIA